MVRDNSSADICLSIKLLGNFDSSKSAPSLERERGRERKLAGQARLLSWSASGTIEKAENVSNLA